MAKEFFYAVKEGRNIGIYATWEECKKEVIGFKNAKYKKFASKEEAQNFIDDCNYSLNAKDRTEDEKKDLVFHKDKYYAFVDGSYLNNEYGWGVAIYKNGELIFEDFGKEEDKEMAKMHNVAGEIKAAMEAALWGYENKKDIIICHDYNGISMWAEKKWRCTKEGTKYYQNFMEQFLPHIKFLKVEAHSGIIGNEKADRLAKKALGI